MNVVLREFNIIVGRMAKALKIKDSQARQDNNSATKMNQMISV